jgi:hypothetical protein
VRYDYRRLLVTAAITVIFYLLSLPFVDQPVYVEFPAKAMLYVAFVLVMIFSSALHTDERTWLRSALKRLVSRRGIKG